jgi:hypothetical protein
MKQQPVIFKKLLDLYENITLKGLPHLVSQGSQL